MSRHCDWSCSNELGGVHVVVQDVDSAGVLNERRFCSFACAARWANWVSTRVSEWAWEPIDQAHEEAA